MYIINLSDHFRYMCTHRTLRSCAACVRFWRTMLLGSNEYELARLPCLIPGFFRDQPRDDAVFRGAHSHVTSGSLHYRRGRCVEKYDCRIKAVPSEREAYRNS